MSSIAIRLIQHAADEGIPDGIKVAERYRSVLEELIEFGSSEEVLRAAPLLVSVDLALEEMQKDRPTLVWAARERDKSEGGE